MGKNYVESSLKRFLKRKVKITTAVVTAFLITGIVIYASEVSFIENGKTNKDEIKIVDMLDNEKYQIIFDEENNILENIGKLEGQVNIKDDTNFLNKGLIFATDKKSNGICFINKLNLTNNGLIKGKYATSLYDTTGNAISNIDTDNAIESGFIINNGTLIGEVNNDEGIGNFNNGNSINFSTEKEDITFEKIENNGVVLGKYILPNDYSTMNVSYTGNGISFNSNSDIDINLKNFNNIGLIRGIIEQTTEDNPNLSNQKPTINNSGNGVQFYTDGSTEIGVFNNKGVIIGETEVKKNFDRKNFLGNGVLVRSLTSNTIFNNSGSISGSINGRKVTYSANGIYIHNFNNTDSGKIYNKGNITGNCISSDTSGSESSGNGIYIYNTTSSPWSLKRSSQKITIDNFGVISGSENGIHANFYKNDLENYLKNYGILAGQQPIKLRGTQQPSMEEAADKGIAVKIDENKNVAEAYGGTAGTTQIENKEYTIINTIKGDSKEFNKALSKNDLKENSNLILNGINKTLEVSINETLELQDSIINSYKTSLNLNDNSTFTGTNIIINGGGIREKNSVNIAIEGSDGINKLNLTDGIINGDIDLKSGNDVLTLAGTQINGNLNGGDGNEDVLNFGIENSTKSSENNNINIFQNISNFEKINVGSEVTLFETSKITDAKNITINKDGNLIVRIDSTEKGSDNVYNSNALVNNNGKVESKDGGTLSIVLNGLGNGDRIDLGNDVSSLEKNKTIKTTSIYHSIKKIEDNNHVVEIGVKEDIEEGTGDKEGLKYNQLNKIHKSIISSGQDGALSGITNDEENGKYLSYLKDIYTGSPYSYSSELSRNSINLFKESILNKVLNPELKKWAFYGGLTHIDGGTRDTYFGKNYYGWDIGSSEIKSDSKILGAYVQGEYKHNETFNAGFILGGNNLESKISTGSNLDGNSFYMGAYAKKYAGNIKLTSGLGFQYGNYDSERYSNSYGIATLPSEKYSADYNDKGFNIYGEMRYLYEVDKNISIEPYLSLNYTYLKQAGVTEDSKPLAMDINSEDFNYTTAKIGIESKKKIFIDSNIHTFVIGASYERFLDGADEKYITAKMRENGSNFDLLVAEKAENIFGFNGKYELETENGFIFDLSGNYVFEKQNHTASGEHKMESQWIIGTGIGYKF